MLRKDGERIQRIRLLLYVYTRLQPSIPAALQISQDLKICEGLPYLQQCNPAYRTCTLFCGIGRLIFSLCYIYTTREFTWNIFISYNQFAGTVWKKNPYQEQCYLFYYYFFRIYLLSIFTFTLILTHPVHQII